MRQTKYKVDKIKVFIQNHNPKKSEIIEHILVDINKVVSRDYYRNNKSNFRGYYNTNLQTMRRAGNIAFDENGKYYVTSQGLKNENSLYVKPDKRRVKELNSLVEHKNKVIRFERSENRELRGEVIRLRKILDKINSLSD